MPYQKTEGGGHEGNNIITGMFYVLEDWSRGFGRVSDGWARLHIPALAPLASGITTTYLVRTLLSCIL
jgi:hypothetical protein